MSDLRFSPSSSSTCPTSTPARLRATIPSWLSGELSSSGRGRALSPLGARGHEADVDCATEDATQRDVRMVAEAQARLLRVVENLSEELATVRSQAMASLEEMRRSVTQCRDGASETSAHLLRHEGELAEFRRHRAEESGRFASMLGEMQYLRNNTGGFGARLAQLDSQIIELRRLHGEACARHNATSAAEGGLVARLTRQESELQAMRRQLNESAARHRDIVSDDVLGGYDQRLDSHERELANVQQLAVRVDYHDSQFAAMQQLATRLDNHEGVVAGVQHLLSRLDRHDSQEQELRERLERCEETAIAVQDLALRLDNYEGPVSSMRQLSGRMAKCEGQLDELPALHAQVDQHEGGIASLQPLLPSLQKLCSADGMFGNGCRDADKELSDKVGRLESEVSEMEIEHKEAVSKYEAAAADIAHLSAEAARHEATIADLMRLHDDVERHEAAIAHLQRHGQVNGCTDKDPESQMPLTKRMEAWQARSRDELITLHTQAVSEIRGELRASLTSHAGAIKALDEQLAAVDEQLWQTDKRLGGRLDELAQGPFAAALARANEVVGSGVKHADLKGCPGAGVKGILTVNASESARSDPEATPAPQPDDHAHIGPAG